MHEVLLERGAERDLNRLTPDVFRRVIAAIRGLKTGALARFRVNAVEGASAKTA